MIYAIAVIVLQACDPAWTALFTPLRPTLGRYEVCASDDRIESIARDATFGEVELLDPLDAFGAAGSYDRARLARVYGGRRASVVHGWRRTPDHFESITLVSPYPDPTLARLLPGTLVIRWIIPT